jgi:general secretion pathway protein C
MRNSADIALIQKPSFQWNAKTLAVIAMFIAILWVTFQLSGLFATLAEKYIPEVSSHSFGGTQDFVRKLKSLSDYQIIINRNLFSSRNLIPGDGDVAPTNAPVKTNLPINLIGTVILSNELKSVASLEDRNEKQVYPVRVDDEIPGKLKVESIEAYKVVFVNLMNNRREYVEMPEDLQGTPLSVEGGTPKKSTKSTGAGSGIEQVSGNQFNIPRAEVDKAFQDMNSILTQARAIPHTENGQSAGYKLIQIVPGSIYEKLGLQNEDVICGLNGEPVNDPGKAFELMNQLKTASRMELCIKRGGKTNNFTYDFR